MISLFVGAAAIVGMAASAGAQSQGSTAPQEKILVTGKSKRICQRSVETGSLMPSRICRTQEEWDELQKGAMATLERIRSNRTFASKDQNDRN